MSNIIFGILVPAVVFIFSFAMTYFLYRHFAGKQDKLSTKDTKGHE
jgi:uncharacterized protein (UPF0333 family)